MKSSDQTGNHSDREHAILSPSSSEIWSKCIGSLSFEKKKAGAAAKAGTEAHEVLEQVLREGWGNSFDDSNTEEVFQNVKEVVDYVDSVCLCLEDEHQMLLEHRVEFNDNLFGTPDVVIYDSTDLHVIDAKFGRIPVAAQDNTQLLLYARMVMVDLELDHTRFFSNIRMHIAQPGINNFDVWEITREQLFTLSIPLTTIASRFKVAITNPEDFTAGTHCRWCPGLATCSTQREYQKDTSLHLIGALPTDAPTTKDVAEKAKTLTTKELLHVFKNRHLLTALVDETAKELFTRARDKKIPGYKIVHTNTKRKWIEDTEYLEKGLTALNVEPYKNTIRGITEIEKEIGKDKLSGLTTKTTAKELLVEESDKRQEVPIKKDLLKHLTTLGE